MARVFMLNDDDIAALLAALNEDPERGGSNKMTTEQRKAHDEAFRFFNYRVRNWIDKVTR